MDAPSPRIAALFVYPVKSCRGLALDSVEVTGRGFAFDREWMVVDEGGRFLTQREEPRLALLRPQLQPGALRLEGPGMTALEVPLAPVRTGQPRSVTVWGFTGPAWDEGEEAADWLSRFLGRRTGLVRWHPDTQRLSSPEWSAGFAAENRFSDAFPILVLSEASLEGLNARRQPAPPLPMNRFRPNLVLGGVTAHAEDAHAVLGSGDVELRLVKPCARCLIVTTDQETAAVDGADPLSTLATYRRDPRFSGVVFGHNALVSRGLGRSLRVGDPVSLH